jgi:hypothetical protein
MPFHKIDGAHVVVKTKGLYRQLDVYTFRGQYFAKKGGGFIPLYRRGTGSADDVLVEFTAGANDLYEGPLGRLLCEDRTTKDCTHRVKVKGGVIENAI